MLEVSGQFVYLSRDFESGKLHITLAINENIADAIQSLKNTKLSIKIGRFTKRRSKDANALLWSCLGEIANVLRTDKWEIYLQMLRRYGKYTYICVKTEAVEDVKKQWRECEEVGHITINERDATQLLCYFGSSTYNSKEFSVLLEGVISEMREMGITPPTSEEMKRSIEEWEKHQS